MDRDCEFLEQEKIMDYSLLVGVHFIDNREKLLTEGWTENPEHFTSFVIYKKMPKPCSSMVVFFFLSYKANCLVEGCIDYEIINNVPTPRLSRGNTDQFLADPNR